MFILLSMSGEALGQYQYMGPFFYLTPAGTKTDRLFNSDNNIISHRHSVDMENGALLYFELKNIEDYNDLKNLDSIITSVNKGIQFYKDTLAVKDYNNVRIDYVIDGETNTTRMRYTTYPRTSDMFVWRKGETSRLKIERDTVRIRIYRPRNLPKYDGMGKANKEFTKNYLLSFPIQITLLVNNYTDIDDILTQYELNQIVDSFYNLTKPIHTRDKRNFGDNYRSTAHIVSSPKENIKYARRVNFVNTYDKQQVRPWNFHGSIGASLVRNTVAPFAEIGIKRKWDWSDGVDHAFLAAYVTPMFFFEKHTDGTYHTYDNWFVTLEYGARVDEEYLGVKVRGGAFGGSYLINPNGSIFKNTTGKLYFSMHLREGITITPEIIFTDNFKSIFPGITLKVF